MKLHLVGGFLGSGKTTAIIQASKALMARGLRVGVVTNDQGKYLVDTAFVRFASLLAVEVTGGCFCCNYADLDGSLDQLIQAAEPDIIFAESVGSCADLVATVVKPLLKLKRIQLAPTSFSIFTDSRLLRRRLRDEAMPFSEDVVYIFDKQIEESGLIVLNKIDLLSSEKAQETFDTLKARYPDRPVLAQNSLSEKGVKGWLELLDSGEGLLRTESLEIDYQRYGHGEAQLAWLDEKVSVSGPDLRTKLERLLRGVVTELESRNSGVGHLKFLIQTGDQEFKISFPTLEQAGWEEQLSGINANQAVLLVNARVEMPSEELRGLFLRELEKSGLNYTETDISAFHPKMPAPTYRME